MGKIYNNVSELIGNTPLVELTHIEEKYNLECRLLAKLEYLNPAGSAKDRVAKEMIDQAERDGLLQPGATIIEPTSGNTGIGLASYAAIKGYKCIIVIPDTMSVERRNIIKAYGAEIVLSDGKHGMKGSIAKAEELQKEIPGSFIPAQFDNPANVNAHRKTTGPEIWRDTDGRMDIFVAVEGAGETKYNLPAAVLNGKFILEATDPAQVERYGISVEGSVVTIADMPKGQNLSGIELKLTVVTVNGQVGEQPITLTVNQEIAATGALADQEVVLTGKLDKKGEYTNGREQAIWWSLEDLNLSAMQLQSFYGATKKLNVYRTYIDNDGAEQKEYAIEDATIGKLYKAAEAKSANEAAKYTDAKYFMGTIDVSNVEPEVYTVELVATTTSNGVTTTILKATSELTFVNPEEDLLPIAESFMDEDGVAVITASPYELVALFDNKVASTGFVFEDLDRAYDNETYKSWWTSNAHVAINPGYFTEWSTSDPLEIVKTEVDKVRTFKVTYNLFGNADNKIEKEFQVKWVSSIYAEDAADVITMTAAKLKIKFDDVTPNDNIAQNAIDFKAITTAVWAEGPNKGTEYYLFQTDATSSTTKYYSYDYTKPTLDITDNNTVMSAGLPLAIAADDLIKFGFSVEQYKAYKKLGDNAPAIYLTKQTQYVHPVTFDAKSTATEGYIQVYGWADLWNIYSQYYEYKANTQNTWVLKSTYANETNFDITTVANYDRIALFNSYVGSMTFVKEEHGSTTSSSGLKERPTVIKHVSFKCANDADNGKFFSMDGADATTGDYKYGATLTAKASSTVDVNLLTEGKKVIPMEMIIIDTYGKTMTYEFEVEISK